MSSLGATLVGTELSNGRYRITAELGEGGMGHVYRAWDANLDTKVVIKVPRSDLLVSSEFASRFALEIRSLVELSHQHIVRVLDAGRQNGRPFAVMQYLGGRSLAERRKKDQYGYTLPCELDELATWLPQIGKALDFIHARGYIHRDVKPSNILFDQHGEVYLSDFGIAKVASDTVDPEEAKSLTATGIVLGTPEYMAPELIMSQAFDGRADQYALAVVIYELICGRLPVDGPTPAAILVRQTKQLPEPLGTIIPEIPTTTSEAVLRALSKDPAERFVTCDEFTQAVLDSIHEARNALSEEQIAVVVGTHRIKCPTCGVRIPLKKRKKGKSAFCPRCESELPHDLDLPYDSGSPAAGILRPSGSLLGTTDNEHEDSNGFDSTRSLRASKTNLLTPSDQQAASRSGRFLHGRKKWLLLAILLVLAAVMSMSRASLFQSAPGGSEADAAAVVQALPKEAPTSPVEASELSVPDEILENTTRVTSFITSRGKQDHAPDADPHSEKSLPPGVIDAIELEVVPPQVVDEGVELVVPVVVKNEDIEDGELSFFLDSRGIEGAFIDKSTGTIHWIPSEEDGPGNYEFNVVVTSSHSSRKSATTSVAIAVSEVNQLPVLEDLEDVDANIDEDIRVPLLAKDFDLPLNYLTYHLLNDSLPGASIDETTKELLWTPAREHAGKLFEVSIGISDIDLDQPSVVKKFSIQVERIKSGPYATVVWIRDPRFKSEAVWGISEVQLIPILEGHARRGFRPTSMTRYTDDAGGPRLAGVWVNDGIDYVVKARLLHNSYNALIKKLPNGFRPSCLNIFRHKDGDQWLATFSKDGANWAARSSCNKKELDQHLATLGAKEFRPLTITTEPGRERYAGLWVDDTLFYRCEYDMTRNALKQFAANIPKGWRLDWINSYRPGKDQRFSASAVSDSQDWDYSVNIPLSELQDSIQKYRQQGLRPHTLCVD